MRNIFVKLVKVMPPPLGLFLTLTVMLVFIPSYVMMMVGAMSQRQLSTESYIGELRKKLSEANPNCSTLARRLIKTESKLNGTKASLEETQDSL